MIPFELLQTGWLYLVTNTDSKTHLRFWHFKGKRFIHALCVRWAQLSQLNCRSWLAGILSASSTDKALNLGLKGSMYYTTGWPMVLWVWNRQRHTWKMAHDLTSNWVSTIILRKHLSNCRMQRINRLIWCTKMFQLLHWNRGQKHTSIVQNVQSQQFRCWRILFQWDFALLIHVSQ